MKIPPKVNLRVTCHDEIVVLVGTRFDVDTQTALSLSIPLDLHDLPSDVCHLALSLALARIEDELKVTL